MKCGNEQCSNKVAYAGDHLCQACFVKVLCSIAPTLQPTLIPQAGAALQKRPS